MSGLRLRLRVVLVSAFLGHGDCLTVRIPTTQVSLLGIDHRSFSRTSVKRFREDYR